MRKLVAIAVAAASLPLMAADARPAVAAMTHEAIHSRH